MVEQASEAKLEGCEGPIFPSNVDELNEAYSVHIKIKRDMMDAIKNIPGAGIEDGGRTSDNYLWDHKISIEDIIFLIPTRESIEAKRSIAVYTKRKVDPAEINNYAEQLLAGMKSIKIYCSPDDWK